SAGLEEVPLGGCSFTWCHKSASKMMDGFEKLVNETWSEAPVDMSNAMLNLMKKLKYLKKKIRAWNNDMRKYSKSSKLTFKAELENFDSIIDKREDKSAGPDGFTFGFYRHFWKLIENDVVAAVKYFFQIASIPKGCNSSYIALIPKIPDAKMDKDFWPISLIGSLYKIIAKILANHLVVVLEDIVNEVQSAFVADRQILDGPFILNELFQWCKSKKKHSFIFKVDFEKAYDPVRWDYLDDVFKKFDFGDRWCRWIQDCLRSSWGSVIVNGSPTEEFQFFKGIVLDSSMQLSHMFYDDDAIFMGQWSDSNIDTIVHVLECIHRASGLRINMSKSKLMGIAMDMDRVEQVASKIGSRLSKWKMKTLSIGGRLTLLKLVLGSIPIYHMSIFKVPMKVLHRMESIRSHFFNDTDLGSKKSIWVKWNNVLASKEKGGIGVSSLYGLNRALMFKWIWRFTTHKSSLWARVIKAIHGDDGKIGRNSKSGHTSIWRDIVQEMVVFKKQGTDICTFMHKKFGNRANTSFWEDVWRGNVVFKYRFPRLYALESHKRIDVAAKLAHSSVAYSFRRAPRSGEEQSQLVDLLTTIEGVSFVSMNDRWVWSLEGSGNFSVASVRKLIDDRRLPDVSSKTRWIKAVPIKISFERLVDGGT
nr:RNA-directed DNA polymerase, eukaryota, reverse transcriptase zinc-binding domain protein [Tanacetum cinerariifolium]